MNPAENTEDETMTSTGTAAKVVRKTPEGSIRIHTHGAITDKGSPFPARKPLPHAIRKRSAITTLSKASAARLRRFLAQAKGPEGWLCFGITLTVPGPPITVSEWRRLWSAYRSRIHRLKNFTLIWRIEMQERGQPHVHCVCWGKTGPGRLREHWLETLGILGPFEGPYDIDREITVTCSDGNYCEIKPGHAIVTHR